ncbi:MAG: helix-hairpin-helix domain-containing protein [Smithella sp.]
MKNPDRATVFRLVDLPNIGKTIANDLQLIGIDHPRKLIGKDPFCLYRELCTISGKMHDPCVIDVFISAVHFMEGGKPLPWWSFTDERKKHIGKEKPKESKKMK